MLCFFCRKSSGSEEGYIAENPHVKKGFAVQNKPQYGPDEDEATSPYQPEQNESIVKKRIEDIKREYQKEIDGYKRRITQLESKIQQPNIINKPETKRRPRGPLPGPQTDSFIGTQAEKVPKTAEEESFLQTAISKNDLLSKYNASQISAIISYMKLHKNQRDEEVIRQGERGDKIYVIQKGKAAVVQNDEQLKVIGAGVLFGEIAILNQCNRTASVIAITDLELWQIERDVFLKASVLSSEQARLERVGVLKQIPFLANSLQDDVIYKIAEAITEEKYNRGDYIITQGEIGKKYYLIKKGKVSVRICKQNHESQVRILSKNVGFGEKALQNDNDVRTASIVAIDVEVIVYALDKHSFRELIGDIAMIDWGAHDLKPKQVAESKRPTDEIQIRNEYEGLTLERDFGFCGLLGAGGFGRVELVYLKEDTDKTFALKCIKRSYVVHTRQEQHTIYEREILTCCQSPFIVTLYRTFKNEKYVYMLMEVCLGGELFNLLRHLNHFNEKQTRFYAACVIEAITYLHGKDIIYRDLKPENVVLDTRGYAKLCDFGLAKRLKPTERTYTVCGTPCYVAPEIIQHQGYGKAVDYWAIGILVFELLVGKAPFDSNDPMTTYKAVINGIDKITMPIRLQKRVINLILRLCRGIPTERLGNLANGMDDIRKHSWFMDFDWDALRNRTMEPAHEPLVSNPHDLHNFPAEEPPHENSFPADEDLTTWADVF